MTTAAANSTTTGILPANTLLRVLGDSIVTITRDGAFVAKQSTARDSFVGPYPVDSTYSVVAGGSAVDIKVTGEDGKSAAVVPATFSTDANNNTVLVGADGSSHAIGLPSQLALRPLPDGQIAGCTMLPTSAGKMLCDFKETVWTQTVGTATTLDFNWTGFDANGVATGITSRTGIPYMLKWTPAGNDERIRTSVTTMINKSLKGTQSSARFGVWLYLENEIGYAPAGTVPNHQMMFELSTRTTTGSEGSQQWTVTFNENQIREGWNFISFVAAGTTDMLSDVSNGTDGGTQPHPIGISTAPYGDGSNGNINLNNVQWIAITLRGANWAGSTIYFDSIWTDFNFPAYVTLGCDQATSDMQIAIDQATSYGWGLYSATPRNMWVSGTVIDGDYADLTYQYPLLDSAHAAGWDIINHSMTHRDLGDMTNAAEIKYEVGRAEAWRIASGYTSGAGLYVSPFSGTSRVSEKVIKDMGIRWQRHARKYITPITPWGIDNPHHCGSIDMGSQTNWQTATKIKNAISHVVRYGGCLNLFWHNIRTLGDPGTGEGVYTTDNLNIYKSNWLAVAADLKAKEDAGLLTVIKPSKLIYGA